MENQDKLFQELDKQEEENLAGGMGPVSDVMPNLGIQNALAVSNSGNTTGGGNSGSGSATADNNNTP